MKRYISKHKDISPNKLKYLIGPLEAYKPKIIAKYFNKQGFEYVDNLLLSSFLLMGAEDALNKLDLSDDAFIINIIYAKEENVINMTGDTQLFITGSVEIDESPETAAIEEITEETFMRPSNIKYLHKLQLHGRSFSWYSCFCSKDGFSIMENMEIRSSNGKNKVGCIVWGNESDIIEVISEIPLYKNNYTKEGICGLACIKVRDIKNIMRVIRHERYDTYAKFYWNTSHEYKHVFTGCKLQNFEINEMTKLSRLTDQ